MGEPDERERVRAAVRDLLATDRTAGGVKPAAHYKNLFPGFWDVVDEECRGPAAASPATRAEGAAAVGARSPDRVGHYRLLRELGSGGMGVVWLAEDVRIGRRVALKVLAPGFASSRPMLQRFQREAEAASRLDHAGICPVYEADFEAETPHIAMRYVEGETLAQSIAAAKERSADVPSLPGTAESVDARRTTTGALPGDVERVVVAIEKAARALHAAHEAGLVHRDVKPGNILVGTDGEPVLLDFGLARAEDQEEQRLSRTGTLLGTPAYMSPEQLTAARIALDRRTDVYSLGVTLYECVTLRLPFEAPTLDGMYQKILAAEPEDPRRLNRRIPRDLGVVIETALQKDRGRRYATALDMAEDLRRVLLLEPIRARPTGPLEKGWRWARRNPALATTLVTLYATLALVAVVLRQKETEARDGQENLRNAERMATIERDRARVERARAEEAAGRATNEEGKARAALAETARVLEKTGAMHLLAESAVVRPADPGLALLLALEGHRRLPGAPSRNAVLAALLPCREGRTFLNAGRVRDLDFSPDGRIAATACDDGVVRLWDPATGRRLRSLRGHAGAAQVVRFLGDGRRLVTLGVDGTVRFWDAATGAETAKADSGSGGGAAVSYVLRGDGVRALFRGADEAYRVVDASPDGAGSARMVRNDGIPFIAAAITGDGRHAVFGLTGASCLVVDLDDGTTRRFLQPGVDATMYMPSQCVQSSRDGAFAAASCGTKNIVWRIADGTAGAVLDAANEIVLDMQFSPDSGRIVAALREPRIWDVATGKVLARLKSTADCHTRVAFSADGRQVAAGGQDGVIRVWSAEGGEPREVLRGHDRAIDRLRFSADGRFLLSSDGGPMVRSWRLGPLPEARVFEGAGSAAVSAAVDPAGERVAVVYFDRTCRISSLATGAPLAELTSEWKPDEKNVIDAGMVFADREPPPGMMRAEFPPGGGRLVTNGVGPAMRTRIWDPATGGLLASPPYYMFYFLQRMDVSPDGTLLAIGALYGRVETCDARTGASLKVLAPGGMMERGAFPPAAFSPDSRMLATVLTGGRAVLVDPRTGAVLRDLESEGKFTGDLRSCMEFSRDGRRLLGFAGGKGRIVVWDTESGKAFPSPTHEEIGETIHARLSPDGTRILAAGTAPPGGSADAGPLFLCDAETGKRVLRLSGHARQVRSAEFQADGRRILTASTDGTARLWDAQSGEEILTLAGHGGAVLEAVFLPDGRRALTCSSDGTARLWPLDPVELAETLRPREFTPVEMERYGIGTPEERAARAKEAAE